MIRSKNIADYFETTFTSLKEGKTIPFAVHLYFRLNDHVIVWKGAGEVPAKAFLDKYAQAGVQIVWIHNDDRALYVEYMGGEAAAQAEVDQAQAETAKQDPAKAAEQKEKAQQRQKAQEEAEKAQAQAAAEAPKKAEAEAGDAAAKNASDGREASEGEASEPQTEEGALIKEVMGSDKLKDEVKAAVIAETAQKVISDAMNAESQEKQLEVDKLARQVVKDVLEEAIEKSETLLQELWGAAQLDPGMDHAINVATYSALFAMAFGKVDQKLLADLVQAGLLHDLGVVKVNAMAAATPWTQMAPVAKTEYQFHVDFGVDLIRRMHPDASARTQQLISLSHEKFDGTGYPKKLEGFKLDDLSQVLALAELTDTLACGLWDGQKRTRMEAFKMLEGFEKARTFPEYFNPEVFQRVTGFIRGNQVKTAVDAAAKFVGEQVKGVLEG